MAAPLQRAWRRRRQSPRPVHRQPGRTWKRGSGVVPEAVGDAGRLVHDGQCENEHDKKIRAEALGSYAAKRRRAYHLAYNPGKTINWTTRAVRPARVFGVVGVSVRGQSRG